MEPSRFFEPYSKKHTIFLLNYQALQPILNTISAQVIYSQPYPTPLEIQAVSPISELLIKHISYVIVQHPNIHQALLQLVPSVYNDETYFWARYFKLLFLKSNRLGEYSTFIRVRNTDFIPQLQHLMYLKKSLLKDEINDWGRVPLESGVTFLANVSNCYEILLVNSTLAKDLINTFILNKNESINVHSFRKSWLSKNSDEFISIKINQIIHCLYGIKSIQFQFIDSLIQILLEAFEFERTYLIIQSFLIKILYKGIYPFNSFQFDYLILSLNDLVKRHLPNYIIKLEENGIESMTIFNDLLKQMLLPITTLLPTDKKMLFLGSILIYGYPLVLNIILITLQLCNHPPLDVDDFNDFISTFTREFDHILTRAWLNDVPQHLQYHYFVSYRTEEEYPSFFDSVPQTRLLQSITPSILPNDFLSIEEARLLNSFLPTRIGIIDLEVIFSTTVNGFSLTNLYYQCMSRNPLILLIKAKGKIFGAYMNDPITISSKYYGNGETFLFSLNPPTKYPATMKNTYFIQTDPARFVFGGGNGVAGLSLDKELHCFNAKVDTFDNNLFTNSSSFLIDRLEVWTPTLPVSVPTSLNTSVSSSCSSSIRMSLDL
ncbi:hypothetical protein ENUP19_0319G0027 [Entamoeba nuttalli]|uniref:Oxidation resistance protein 1 n=2 Tax=Entamoeba nuttalli TaxID=412467 RepID=K2GJ79_ENTNP|nr:TLD domain containing protein [Entamoeba nuttalli P19]EKE42806.1 TLD domain containing protein [Entamoeba nuttalli P19]|eukprot:XP_008854859.1 TLD domain containing protein [Entamoeba nuttalli P19]